MPWRLSLGGYEVDDSDLFCNTGFFPKWQEKYPQGSAHACKMYVVRCSLVIPCPLEKPQCNAARHHSFSNMP